MLINKRGAYLVISILFTQMVQLQAIGMIPNKNSLPTEDIRKFRSWIALIVEDQIARGPNPRWQQRDCASLLRFAVHEAVISHDVKWRRSNGLLGEVLPAEIEMPIETRKQFGLWQDSEGKKNPYAKAMTLIQENSKFLNKTGEGLEPGDLLFFDQGDNQHLMIWTGRRVVYHNGSSPPKKTKRTAIENQDNGLRTATLQDLLKWPDSRWRPDTINPNFIGFFRLTFLDSHSSRGFE